MLKQAQYFLLLKLWNAGSLAAVKEGRTDGQKEKSVYREPWAGWEVGAAREAWRIGLSFSGNIHDWMWQGPG